MRWNFRCVETSQNRCSLFGFATEICFARYNYVNIKIKKFEFDYNLNLNIQIYHNLDKLFALLEAS